MRGRGIVLTPALLAGDWSWAWCLAWLGYPGVGRHGGVLRTGPGPWHPVPRGVPGLGAGLGLSVVTGELLLLLHVGRPGVALHARLARVLLWNVLLGGGVLTTRVASSEVPSTSPLVVRVGHPSLARHPLARVTVHTARAGTSHPAPPSHHLLLLPRHSTRITLLLTMTRVPSSSSSSCTSLASHHTVARLPASPRRVARRTPGTSISRRIARPGTWTWSRTSGSEIVVVVTGHFLLTLARISRMMLLVVTTSRGLRLLLLLLLLLLVITTTHHLHTLSAGLPAAVYLVVVGEVAQVSQTVKTSEVVAEKVCEVFHVFAACFTRLLLAI